MADAAKRFGKYRATVAGNHDPEARGRVRMLVPAVLGTTPSGWAEACLASGAAPHAPAVGVAVWAEFEGGDINQPIWSGCRVTAASPTADLALSSPGGQGISVSDTAPSPTTGGVVLHSAGGASIVVNDSGIYLGNGRGATITLVGPATAINGDALVVT